MPALNQRYKWLAVEQNIVAGDVVLVLNSDSPQDKSLLGYVGEVVNDAGWLVSVI